VTVRRRSSIGYISTDMLKDAETKMTAARKDLTVDQVDVPDFFATTDADRFCAIEDLYDFLPTQKH